MPVREGLSTSAQDAACEQPQQSFTVWPAWRDKQPGAHRLTRLVPRRRFRDAWSAGIGDRVRLWQFDGARTAVDRGFDAVSGRGPSSYQPPRRAVRTSLVCHRAQAALLVAIAVKRPSLSVDVSLSSRSCSGRRREPSLGFPNAQPSARQVPTLPTPPHAV
jgi:hypothetical protein